MKRFVPIAPGSASELEYHLLLANDLCLLTNEELEDLEAKVLEIQRMVAALVQRLRRPLLAARS
jgi:four helix bundle protein